MQEQAREAAEERPAVALADCPKHKGHSQECYDRGHGDGWNASIEFVCQVLREGKFKNFYEFYDHYTEGQVAT